MSAMSADLVQAWENREGPVIFVTVSADGTPNAIYATCVGKYDNSTLVVADNYFNKTRENILGANHQGCILFTAKGGKAYQIKGTLEYHREGPVYDFMKSWNPKQHPGNAAAALKVTSAFSGAAQLC
ncbi:MAG: pyridoxamine 5'-phosphate oxidase family protein [Lentisphaeria bacterium]|nr:pyridoxamine 5'-phosphate oxidase family protein [Lentisphaeria bacterium]